MCVGLTVEDSTKYRDLKNLSDRRRTVGNVLWETVAVDYLPWWHGSLLNNNNDNKKIIQKQWIVLNFLKQYFVVNEQQVKDIKWILKFKVQLNFSDEHIALRCF